MDTTREAADAIAESMRSQAITPLEAINLGNHLCDPNTASLYFHPYFVANCVTELSSIRVNDLLGAMPNETTL